MVDRIHGIEIKLQRARSFREELQRDAKAFLDTVPFAIERTADGDKVRFMLRILRPVPEELALPLGDSLNALRSALDYTMWQLVEANGGTPDASIFFPISKSKQAFQDAVKSLRKKAGASAGVILLQVEAYPGGAGNRLRELSELNNRDKHRLLVPVGSAYQALVLDATAPFRNNPSAVAIPDDFPPLEIAIRPADSLYPLRDGAVLFNTTVEGEQSHGPPKFTFDLAFGDVVGGQPLVETLDAFQAEVEAVVNRFRHLLS